MTPDEPRTRCAGPHTASEIKIGILISGRELCVRPRATARHCAQQSAPIKAEKEKNMLLLIILVVLIFGFGYGGYRAGPGLGYYGGGGLSLILVIVLVLLLLKVI